MVRVIDKVEPDGRKVLGVTEQDGAEANSHWENIFESWSAFRGVYERVEQRYALNLSCEKAELLYAAFWTHCG